MLAISKKKMLLPFLNPKLARKGYSEGLFRNPGAYFPFPPPPPRNATLKARDKTNLVVVNFVKPFSLPFPCLFFPFLPIPFPSLAPNHLSNCAFSYKGYCHRRDPRRTTAHFINREPFRAPSPKIQTTLYIQWVLKPWTLKAGR